MNNPAAIQDEMVGFQEYIKNMAPSDEPLSECLRQLKPNMPLHGTYHHQPEEDIDMGKAYQWLEKAGLKDSIEAVIMATQDL